MFGERISSDVYPPGPNLCHPALLCIFGIDRDGFSAGLSRTYAETHALSPAREHLRNWLRASALIAAGWLLLQLA
jgi:hypothetical protein